MFDDKVLLLTGGTGSFGKKFTGHVLNNYNPKKVIIFSRDEFKQSEMSRIFPDTKYPVRYFLGDVRDKERLYRAFDGVDYVIHAAAIKQVPSAEYNPFEAVKTNILGAQNIVEAAIDTGVKRVIALSTDKAVSPINLYGATKLAMEKLFISANAYVGSRDTAFSVVRYGNVVGSRGSVIPLYKSMISNGGKRLPVTDDRMTRFWITLQQGVRIVCNAVEETVGGEVFVPKIPSMKITELMKAMAPDFEYEIVGIRPGEKLHETLVSEDDGRNTVDMGSYYVILPSFAFKDGKLNKYLKNPRMDDGFCYRSDKNWQWLSAGDISKMTEEIDLE
ncbi:MAG: UDP-N-acetylglucosamine 4,6-dehydratase (inverting) [Thermodesulfovibrio sp. RBG_19FT_COMBO_42_12]|nr:MAG: UDP-N-acetylglucosamine 4,6-dehydratase (inverting) [Thermodesulfovibrio sp. RBG_19FT_COMBO_42_12]HZX48153.1 UDP-N-acetylglucosamine 4,6-dehydratase (inverting) [Nitrospirota bacterium]